MSVDVPVIFCQACITTNINHMDAGHLVVNLTSWIQHMGAGQSFCTDPHMCPKYHLKTVRTDPMDRSVIWEGTSHVHMPHASTA